MTTTQHYDIGETVAFKSIEGNVLSVHIKPGPAILYEIGYLEGMVWREVWAHSFMVTPAAKEKLGFRHKTDTTTP